MKRLRLLFYFTTIGIALGYFFAVLLSFFVQYAMLADESLVVFVWTVYAIRNGVCTCFIDVKPNTSLVI